MKNNQFIYDVALSFAGEDRPYVRKVADALILKEIKVFYDEYQKAQLWGQNLYVHLQDIYQNQAKYTVVFISENYAKKVWTNHEMESAQARALKENKEYILPVRFDNTKIPGLLDTIAYIDVNGMLPEELAITIYQKLSYPLSGKTIKNENKEERIKTSQLIIKRVKKNFGGAIKFDLYVDDESVISLENGDFKEFKIKSGKRAIQIKYPFIPSSNARGWGSGSGPGESNILWCNFEPDSSIKLECGTGSFFRSPYIKVIE